MKALEAYAAERNAKRAMGITGIPEHAVWHGESGSFTFRGFRILGGQNCVLLEKDDKLYIKLCSEYEKKRLHKAGRGAPVAVSEKGRASLVREGRGGGMGGRR